MAGRMPSRRTLSSCLRVSSETRLLIASIWVRTASVNSLDEYCSKRGNRRFIIRYLPCTPLVLWSSPGGAIGRSRIPAAVLKNASRRPGGIGDVGLFLPLLLTDDPLLSKVTKVCGVKMYDPSNDTVLASD